MENGKPKTAIFACPSKCGEILKVNLWPQMGRAWSASLDRHNRLTLKPSVALETGCQAHFVMAENAALLWF